MNSILFLSKANVAAGCLALAVLVAPSNASADSGEKVLYSFKGGSDGSGPVGSLYTDNSGNYYGTTAGGGGGSKCEGDQGCGTVFKLALDGTEAVLYAFAGGNDGAFPYGGLISDSDGNLYGTTSQGGSAHNYGTVFSLAADGIENVLYAFKGGNDGISPVGTLTIDDSGNVYGVTFSGGNGTVCGNGCGTLFELSVSGNETVQYQFQGGSDGGEPGGGLIRDDSNNLYGTTSIGGTFSANCSIGCGTLFKFSSDGTESVLHAFQGGNDGDGPKADLLMDQSGDLYGTTEAGGSCSLSANGCGTVFRVTPGGAETVLYAFKGGSNGQLPYAGLTIDNHGDLYGTTFSGGSTGCKGTDGCGTAFKLTPSGKETVLYVFNGRHGANPTAALLEGSGNFLLGTASGGGAHHHGVVFRLKK